MEPRNMNRQRQHGLHPAVGGTTTMHNAHSLHNSNPYVLNSQHYPMIISDYSMLQPVNLIGNMASQQHSGNVIDLHQRSPKTTMPSQVVHPRVNHTHQTQTMHSNERLSGNQQMQSQHHLHGMQHNTQMPQVSNMNLSSLSNQQKNFNHDHPVRVNSPSNLQQPHILAVESLECRENVQEIGQIKTENMDNVVDSEHLNVLLPMIEEDNEADVNAAKLIVERSESENEDENDENRSGKQGKKFKCNICPKRFVKSNTLKTHLKSHEQDDGKSEGRNGDFQCNQCPKNFIDSYHLNRHRNTHGNRVYRCEVCRFDFYVKREYNRHMKIHAGVKTFLCSVCSKTFTDKVKFSRHMRAHEGIKPFQCNVCSESFTQRSNLNIHLRIHDGIRPFQCSVCYISFTNKSDLNRHARIHNGVKPFLCSMCAKCFSRKDDLNRHMKIHEGSKRYLCTMCPKCFTRKDDLNRHLRNHDGLKPFHCTVCFESFTQKALLNIHLRIHTNSKPHTCSVCSESFSQETNLHIHLKLQHGVNPFKCDQCPNESFEKETHLSLHMRSVHGDRPFKCSMCEEGFSKKSDMKEHMRAAHNVNPFKCDICFKCFSKKSNLRSHIMSHKPIPCDKCPEIFETKADLQDHVDKCHNLHTDGNEEEDVDDLFDEPKEKSFNCSECLSIVRMPSEIKVELPFVCSQCTDENSSTGRENLKPSRGKSKLNEKVKEKRRSVDKCDGAASYECLLCEKTFSYRLSFMKHCKKVHNVDIEDDFDREDDAKSKKSAKSITSTIEKERMKKELGNDSHRDKYLSGPIGEFKCALCDKIFVRKGTLDRHVSVHGISSAEHDELMGRDTSAMSDGINQSLDSSESDHLPAIAVNIKQSDDKNVYIVTPKDEPMVKEEILSDYEDSSMLDSYHENEGYQTPSEDEDDVPLSQRSLVPSSNESTSIAPKRGRPKGVSNKRKSVPKSDAETTDNDENGLNTDHDYEDDSRNGESEVEENVDAPKKRGRRKKINKQTEFPCVDCGKVFSRKTTLKRHVRIHIGIKEYQCWICSKCFMEKSHLIRHLQKHAGVKESLESDAPYCCSICDRKFTIKGQLSRHLKAHENAKPDLPQTCELCQKTFDKKSKYKRHMTVHDGIRDHQCQVCGNRFKQKSNLKIHMKIHEGIRAHECDVCMLKFTNKSDLNRHMRKHNGLKPFLCSICAKNFSRKDDLNRHMRKHDGIKPFLCSMCGDAFSRKDHLKKHMRKCYGPPTGEYKPRKRVRRTTQQPAREDGIPSLSATHGIVSQDLSLRELPQYRPAGVVNNVSAHAQQVLHASVGQAAASGLLWCAQYYTNPPAIEFAPKPEYYV